VARKQTDTVKLQLRLTERLRRLLEQAAKDQKRSMNAEIMHRLDQSFLQQNLAALMREHIDNTAEKVAEKVAQQFRGGQS
jgi:hypothetical protein